jgi:2'-5' RNA ligase
MPAHVTLIYPFTDDSQLVSGRISEVRNAIEQFTAFEFALSEVRRFDNLPNESYLWLAPNPAEPFIEMVKALAAAFPEHPPFGGAYSEIVPHLTVAYSTDADVLGLVEEQLLGRLPITAHATTASIMEHADGKWRQRARLPLARS